MLPTRIMIISIGLLLYLPALSIAQSITLDNYLSRLMQSHPLFEREELSVEAEVFSRDANLGSQDWRISSGPSFARQNPLPPGTFSPEQIDFTSFNAGIERAFWQTGGRLSVLWQSDIQNSRLPDLSQMAQLFGVPEEELAGPSEYFQNNAIVTYSQPLLQNFRGRLDRLGYDLGEYSVKKVNVQALENQEGFLLKMGLAYIDWVLLVEQTAIATERLSLTEQQFEQAKKKRASNIIDQVDVLRAEDAVRIAEQGVVLINAQLKGKQAELAVISQQPDLTGMQPDFDLYTKVALPEFDIAAADLRQNSRILKPLEIQRQQLERQQSGLEESIKPQLYLNTQVTLKSGDSAFGDAMGLDKNDLGASLQFSYPLGNRSARNRAQKNALQIRQVALSEDDAALALEAGLQSILIQLREFERALELNRRQIETAKLRTAEEQERYNKGRGDLAFVIQSQDSEERARLTYAQNAATYQRLHLQLKALLDTLLPG
ncbi:TolC family protein [Candidatus Neomarinimicrobiota bacterium]